MAGSVRAVAATMAVALLAICPVVGEGQVRSDRGSALAGVAQAQERCNLDAFALYKAQGYLNEPTGTYTIHYSGKRKQCLAFFRKMDRSTMPGNDLELRSLIDVATKTVYGNYVFSDESQRTIECDVLDLAGKRRECSSLAEFEQLLADYLE